MIPQGHAHSSAPYPSPWPPSCPPIQQQGSFLTGSVHKYRCLHQAQSIPRTPGARIHTVTPTQALHPHTLGRPVHIYTSCRHGSTELLTFVKPSVYVSERDAVHQFQFLEEPFH